MAGVLQIYKHLPVVGIEAMKTPHDHTVHSLRESLSDCEISMIVGWNVVIPRGEMSKNFFSSMLQK
jgi:hypothetical protein